MKKIYKNWLYKLIYKFQKNKQSFATAYDFLAVQPLPPPTGQLFYLDYVYENPRLFKRILLTEKYKKPEPTFDWSYSLSATTISFRIEQSLNLDL